MTKLYYTEREFEKIINIFSSNNVKLEFENPKLLCSAIQDISEYCYSKELNLHFEKYNQLVCLEFDVLNKRMLSIGSFYPNSSLSICGYPEVYHHLKIIHEIFSFYSKPVIDYFGKFAIGTSADDNKLEKIYFWLSDQILLEIAEESWDDVLSIFNISQKNINFLKLDINYTSLSYLGFTPDGLMDNIGFSVSVEKFFDRNPIDEYSNYVVIEKVCGCLSNDMEEISLQYSAKNQSYFAIEVFFDTLEELNNLYYLMHKNSVISDIEYKNFTEMNISSEYIKFIVKFRWKDQNTFSTKLYLEKIPDEFNKNSSVA
jgi:hypothetical protein